MSGAAFRLAHPVGAHQAIGQMSVSAAPAPLLRSPGATRVTPCGYDGPWSQLDSRGPNPGDFPQWPPPPPNLRGATSWKCGDASSPVDDKSVHHSNMKVIKCIDGVSCRSCNSLTLDFACCEPTRQSWRPILVARHANARHRCHEERCHEHCNAPPTNANVSCRP